jgi:hypothetical protein
MPAKMLIGLNFMIKKGRIKISKVFDGINEDCKLAVDNFGCLFSVVPGGQVSGPLSQSKLNI